MSKKSISMALPFLLLAVLLVSCGENPTATTTPTLAANTTGPAPATTSITGAATTVPFTPIPTVTPGTTATTTRPATTAVPTTTRTDTTAATTTAAPTTPANTLPWTPAQVGQLPPIPGLQEHEKAMLPTFKNDVKLVQEMNSPVYNIALKVEFNGQNVTGRGSQQLFYTNDTGNTLDELYLWLWANAPTEPGYVKPVSVSNVRLNGQQATTSLENGQAQLKIALNKLKPGERVVVELDFTLKFPGPEDYNYFKYDNANQLLTLAFWYPQLAVYSTAHQGWDRHPYNAQGDVTNSRVSFFNFWLTVPSTQIPVINGAGVEKKANADGTSTYRYVTGPMRDLVGTMSPRYQSASLKAGETTVTSYFLERDRVWGERAARFAVDSLIIFNDLYGQYPYAEYKLAEVALDEFGGFEFPAMTLITTRYYKDSMALSMENVVAHETAHQWWYGLVGSDQILEAWQDEGLCQYSPVLYFERFHSKTEGQRILEIYMLSGFRNLVDSGLDDVVNQPVFAWKNFNTYLMVVYNKGGAFYNAYRTTFGDTAFKRFAGYYFERNRYKFVSEDAILEALRYGAGVGQEQAANELIRRWLNSKEGYKDR